MNFAQQSNPAGHGAGFALVIVLHLALGYALANGLGRKVVDVLKRPLDVALVQEIKPPPAPPPKPVPRAAKARIPPPPSYAPPPEVRIEAPPAPSAITTTAVPQPSPPPEAPAIAAAPPVPAAPQAVSIGLACPNHAEVRSRLPYPPQAQQMGLSGDVLVEFTLSASGQVNDVMVVKSSNKLFNGTATSAVGQLHCVALGRPVRVRVPFTFRMDA